MRHPTTRHSAGFSLFEVMMALFLMVLISGMVLAIARSSLDLGQAIVKKQAREMQQQAFFEFLSRRFAAMPGNARLELLSEQSGLIGQSGQSGQRYLSELTLQDVPVSFTWGGQNLLAQAIQISTLETRSGYLDIVMRYYENEILEGSGSDFEPNAEPEEPYAEITLLRDVNYFEWRVLDSNTMEWEYDWKQQGRLPLQLELQLSIGADGESMRHVFWLPPKQNPEVAMRQLGAAAQPQAGAGNSGTGANINIEIGSPLQTQGGNR